MIVAFLGHVHLLLVAHYDFIILEFDDVNVHSRDKVCCVIKTTISLMKVSKKGKDQVTIHSCTTPEILNLPLVLHFDLIVFDACFSLSQLVISYL